ncbi:MAG: chemotaxis protein CheW [Ilumatobacteraceae bacterium]|nr:chemotaxis protein CheW [Ilumatobacteraceae bacterium]
MRAVTFPLGMDRYAIATASVREVVADLRPTPLPTAPSVFLGVFNLRGEIVPIFDTAALLGFRQATGSSVAVVVSTAVGPAALVVGGHAQIATLDEPVGPSELAGTIGTYALRDGVTVLIDVEALLRPHTNLAGARLPEGAVR